MNPDRYRCPECRTRRTSGLALAAHVAQCPRPVCWCSGYLFPHRPGSPYCEKNAMAPLRSAIRAGNCTDEELLEIQLDCALLSPGKPMREWRD